MNEKHMQYILAVLREGSVTAAAKKLLKNVLPKRQTPF